MSRLKCNIDRRGRLARGLGGTLLLVASLAAALFGVAGATPWLRWLIVTVLALLGGFHLFEAWASWCVARAMGFKTPI